MPKEKSGSVATSPYLNLPLRTEQEALGQKRENETYYDWFIRRRKVRLWMDTKKLIDHIYSHRPRNLRQEGKQTALTRAMLKAAIEKLAKQAA